MEIPVEGLPEDPLGRDWNFAKAWLAHEMR
jgi:hypothetical protein